MLKIFERELTWQYHFLSGIARRCTAGSQFAKAESQSLDLSGKWDNTIFAAADVNAYQDANNVLAFSEVKGTKGSFVQDVDGNILLDLCGTESQPLGHNHGALIKHVNSKHWDQYVVNAALDASRTSSGDFSSQAAALFRALQPNPRLGGVRLTGSRSATELAVIDAFRNREGKSFALGFAGAYHGQGLAMSQFAHPQQSNNSLRWPALDSNQSDEQVLEQVRSTINRDFAVVVLEPVNWQNGRSFSDSLISQIGDIAHENEALLVVDETNTGAGATGRGFWAYNGDSADYVAFGKRTQATGYYHDGHGVQLGGSEHNVALLEIINAEINNGKLVEHVKNVGEYMHRTVKASAEKSSRITSVNSAGTMLWINTGSPKDAMELRDHLRRHGILVKLNGMQGVVAKPALNLQEQHVSSLASAVAKF